LGCKRKRIGQQPIRKDKPMTSAAGQVAPVAQTAGPAHPWQTIGVTPTLPPAQQNQASRQQQSPAD